VKRTSRDSPKVEVWVRLPAGELTSVSGVCRIASDPAKVVDQVRFLAETLGNRTQRPEPTNRFYLISKTRWFDSSLRNSLDKSCGVFGNKALATCAAARYWDVDQTGVVACLGSRRTLVQIQPSQLFTVL